jgi:hypothetical protein
LLNLAWGRDKLSDLADVKWIIVSLRLGLGVGDVWVFPGLRESAIVPEISFMGEAVAHESQFSLLGVLQNGVESFLLGDLMSSRKILAYAI